MADFFLDPIAGVDASDGTTFANRWKTFNLGATAARTAPGDRIKCIASLDPTSLAQSATFTNASKTVTLTTAVTADIDTGEASWTASANVTTTTSTTRKEGSTSASIAIGSAFTTGLAAYKAFGATDFSGYQQISFWIDVTAGTIASAGQLQIKLCSDAVGATPVDTFDIPVIPLTFTQHCITIDKGSALGASIQSVALYVVTDVGAQTILLDNIIACKASSADDSLSLNSLIAKIWAKNWAPLTTYAVNDIRKPTTPNRTGYSYKVTSISGSPGHSGSSEPTWPRDIGETVVDGELTWTCTGLEETWLALKSIRGTTLLIDNNNSGNPTAGRGYSGITESVTIMKREPLQVTMPTGSTNPPLGAIQESGTQDSMITYSGGWDRTDMSTQTGETWVTGRNGSGIGIALNAKTNLKFEHFGMARFFNAYSFDTANSGAIVFQYCHASNFTSNGFDFATSVTLPNKLIGCQALNGGTSGIGFSNNKYSVWLRAFAGCGNLNDGIGTAADSRAQFPHATDIHLKNNTSYGLELLQQAGTGPMMRVIASGNGTADTNVQAASGPAKFFDSSLGTITTITAGSDFYVYSYRDGQVANAHLVTTDGGTVISATDQRNTASGISWKFRPTSTDRGSQHPIHIPVLRVGFAASAEVTLGIWVRRDSTNIKGKFIVRGGQVPGVGEDISVACEPSINTWTEFTMAFTPAEAGVVEAEFEAWDGVGTTNNLWIDDATASQA
jgi:hypothetical protein